MQNIMFATTLEVRAACAGMGAARPYMTSQSTAHSSPRLRPHKVAVGTADMPPEPPAAMWLARRAAIGQDATAAVCWSVGWNGAGSTDFLRRRSHLRQRLARRAAIEQDATAAVCGVVGWYGAGSTAFVAAVATCGKGLPVGRQLDKSP